MATRSKERFYRPIEKFLIALVVLLGLGLVTLAVFGDHGIITYLELRRAYGEMESRVEKIEKENKRLTREINALRNDPATMERIAREELGMIKPGEILYHVKRSEEQ